MNRIFLICLLSFVIATTEDERNLSQIIHDGNNKFTANMFYEVAKTDPGRSVALSAFSVMTPLAQLALASVGESHDELLDSIGMPNDNIAKTAFSLVNMQLRAIKGITLKIATKIYIAEKFELNTEFAALTQNAFGSEIQSINFVENEDAAKEINAWVKRQTNKRIKNLIDAKKLDKDSAAVLVNAIYFKGTWKDSFNKALTINGKFYVSNNNYIEVPMMARTGSYRYAVQIVLNAQILEIPYKGDESSFVIVLPNNIDGIEDLEEKFRNPAVFDKVLNDLVITLVDVTIPKFRIETTIDLKDILQKINVKKIFYPRTARLDNLIKDTGDLYIDSAVQKTFIDVNEEGSEAAAGNQMDIALESSYLPQPVISFVADHPFIFILTQGKNIIFNGIYRGLL